METIKLSGNKFPVAESPLVEHAKNAEKQVEDQEQDDIEHPLKEQDLAFEHSLKEFESEDEKNEKRTLIRKIMRYTI